MVMRKVIVTCRHGPYARQITEEVFEETNYQKIEYLLESFGQGEEYLAEIKKSSPVAIIDVRNDVETLNPPGPAVLYRTNSNSIEKWLLPLLETLLEGKDSPPYVAIHYRNFFIEHPPAMTWSYRVFRENHGFDRYNLNSLLLPIRLIKEDEAVHREHLTEFLNMLEHQLSQN